jgi:hypothetical protein
MPQDRGSVREIAWREICPWLLLFHAFRISIQVWQITLGSLGLLSTILGWSLLAWVFGGSKEEPLALWLEDYRSTPWNSAHLVVVRGSTEIFPNKELYPGSAAASTDPPTLGGMPANPFVGPWRLLQAPFRQLFDPELRITGLAFLLCCGFWTIAVWGLFGGALTRRAAVQLGREENVGIKTALAYAVSKWRGYFASPLLPMIGVLICSAPMFLFGLVMRADLGVAAAGVIWPALLVGGLCIAMLLLVLVFGWPLMWPTISTEGSDSFDALSRPWSYVYHRPLNYLFYAAVATVLGGLGWLFVYHFADWVAYLPKWVVSWGAGHERATTVFPEIYPAQPNAAPSFGSQAIGFWSGCVRLIALGFVYSYFWTASTAIYLLLRRDEDGTEFDDVHLDEQPAHDLPTLEKDSAGVPLAPKKEPSAAPQVAPASEADGGSPGS